MNIFTGAKDLISQLLQPDSSRRIMLDEVMHHLWITKDGTQPLKPYEHPAHDPVLQATVNTTHLILFSCHYNIV